MDKLQFLVLIGIYRRSGREEEGRWGRGRREKGGEEKEEEKGIAS